MCKALRLITGIFIALNNLVLLFLAQLLRMSQKVVKEAQQKVEPKML